MFWGKDETQELITGTCTKKDQKLLSGEEWLAKMRDKIPGGVQRLA